MPKQLQLPTKSQREHDTDLCQEMPTTGPPALASASSRPLSPSTSHGLAHLRDTYLPTYV